MFFRRHSFFFDSKAVFAQKITQLLLCGHRLQHKVFSRIFQPVTTLYNNRNKLPAHSGHHDFVRLTRLHAVKPICKRKGNFFICSVFTRRQFCAVKWTLSHIARHSAWADAGIDEPNRKIRVVCSYISDRHTAAHKRCNMLEACGQVRQIIIRS